MLMVSNNRMNMLITCLWPLVIRCIPECRFRGFSVLTGKLRDNLQRLSSVSWHLVTIRVRLTGLFWIVWKLFGTEQCLSTPPVLCQRLSHQGPDVSTGTMYQSLVATLSLVYTAPSVAPWTWQQLTCFQPLSPSLFLRPFDVLPQMLGLCLCGFGGGGSDQGSAASVGSEGQ